jgi:putative mycofactocin binding protein MftB
VTIALDAPYAIDPQVAIRPEPFGALCYHYGNRRLTFLKSRDMVRVVEALAEHPSAADALRACGIAEAVWPSYANALASLQASEVIRER